MSEIRHLHPADYTDLVAIYNHYIEHTAITFDIEPYTVSTRTPWFEQFSPGTRHVCLVAEVNNRVVGYANSAKFRSKAAYATSVESSVYLHPEQMGSGLGSRLYGALFDYLGGQDVHRVYAGVTLPNDASVRLHERMGFAPCGLFREVGYKFEQFWDVQWFEKPL